MEENYNNCSCEKESTTSLIVNPPNPVNWPTCIMYIGVTLAIAWAFRGCCGH